VVGAVTRTAAAVTHPTVEAWQFVALMQELGWSSRMELLRGEVVVTPPDGGPASVAGTELVYRVRSWQEGSGDEGLALGNVYVRFGDEFLGPDLVWWGAARRPPTVRGAIEVVPDLVAEVLSPSTRENDLGPKRATYAACGVRELWLVDPEARTVAVERPAGAERRAVLGEPEALESPLLPGFALPVAAIFATA